MVIDKVAAYIWSMSTGNPPDKYETTEGKAKAFYGYHAEQIIALVQSDPDLITLLWDAHQDLGDWLRYAQAVRCGEEKRKPSENGSRASMALQIRLSEMAMKLQGRGPEGAPQKNP